MIPTFVFLFCLFATYASYLLLTRKSAVQRARLNRRLADLLLPADTEDENVSLVKEELLSEIPFLHNWLKKVSLATRLREFIEQSDVQITVSRLLMFSALAGISACLATLAISGLFWAGALVGALAMAVPFLHVRWKRKQRLHKFLVELPDALEMLSRALSAGSLFPDALLVAATEAPEPIATEFRRAYDEHHLGLPLNLALENLTQRVPLLDLQICVTAVLIQRETGGNIAEILDNVATTIRGRFHIMEDLKTLTTSSRLSAWVLCGIPVAVAIVETSINTDYMRIMWQEPIGQKLIALAVMLQVAGMFIVRKILQIKI